MLDGDPRHYVITASAEMTSPVGRRPVGDTATDEGRHGAACCHTNTDRKVRQSVRSPDLRVSEYGTSAITSPS
ncbi:hypothetical protein J6590_001545 [Homalodisca vitripennis]|nr:hypothetical protein J6590_001545 [Homalodisca vitripennis]